MLSLSPAKLLVILVIALIVLGPEKLPQVARQIGAAWHDLRQWRSRIESEVRGAFPDLPPTHEVATIVRSPLAFLDRLADEHEKALQDGAASGTEPGPDGGPRTLGPAPPLDAASSNGSAPTNGSALTNGSAPGTVSDFVTGSGQNGVAGHNGRGSEPATVDASGEPAGVEAPGAFPAVPDDPSMN